MTAVLKIIEKELGGRPATRSTLRLASERITARELIARRVRDEVARLGVNERHNAGRQPTRSFLISFGSASPEIALNPNSRWQAPKPIDEGAEIETALVAFESNKFLMLLDDTQVENLDDELTLTDNSELVFLRLTPLVSG